MVHSWQLLGVLVAAGAVEYILDIVLCSAPPLGPRETLCDLRPLALSMLFVDSLVNLDQGFLFLLCKRGFVKIWIHLHPENNISD